MHVNLRLLSKRLFVLSSLLFIASLSTARGIYVSSKKGNKGNSGLSAGKPKNLIQDAVDMAKPGDVIYVMDGVYTNACATCNVVDIQKGGTAARYLTLTNYPDNHPVIKFDGWAGISINNNAAYIKISGFEVIGDNDKVSLKEALKQPASCANKTGTFDPKFNGNGIAVSGTLTKHPHHIVIFNNTVHDCSGGGIGATQADYIIVDHNLIYNTSWYSVFGTSGIAFYQFHDFDKAGGYHSRITRNKCYNNKSLVPCIKQCVISDGNGIIIDDFRNWQTQVTPKPKPYAGRTLVENNVCWYNGGTAIHTFQSDHVDIVNNTAYCNSQTREEKVGQILPSGSSYIQLANNIIVTDSSSAVNSNFLNKKLSYAHNLHYNKTYPSNTDCMIYNATCIMGKDPLFVAPGNSLHADFRLRTHSPAIDHGSTVLYSRQDMDGHKRPNGRAPDMGAYEH